LESLSLGENHIDSIHDRDRGVGPQLFNLKMLKDLNLIGNPLKEKKSHSYHLDILSYLPNLVYLDNVKIPVSLSREVKQQSQESIRIRKQGRNIGMFDCYEFEQLIQEMRNKMLAQISEDNDAIEKNTILEEILEPTDKNFIAIIHASDREKNIILNEFKTHKDNFQEKVDTMSNDMIQHFGEMVRSNQREHLD